MTHTTFPLSADALERLAQRRAKAKMGWYMHAGVYLLVNLLLVTLAASSGRSWAAFPALGWGLGLFLHGMAVFLLSGGSDWHARILQAERERLARRGQGG